MIRSSSALWVILILGLVTAPAALADQCQDCHNSSIFKVKNKALYDHHVGYETSVHALAGLSCVDCHGGDPETADKDLAHAGVREQVKYPNIPATCGKCHKTQYEAFIGSDHFEITTDERDALNCIVCHGSMDMDVTFVVKVHRKCMKCHDNSDDPASVDVLADALLSRINAIMGYRDLVLATTSDKVVLDDINQEFGQLVSQWHRLDLEGAEATSQALLANLRRAVGGTH